MAQQEGERTEPATPKRREEARRRGEVAQSREVQSVVVLGAALLLATLGGAPVVQALVAQARALWGGAASPPDSLGAFTGLLLAAGGQVGLALLPLLLVLAAAGALSQLVQTGPMLSLEALEWRGSRLDPIQGARRLLNGDRLFDLLKSLLKVAAVGLLATWVVKDRVGLLLGLPDAGLGDSLGVIGHTVRTLATRILAALAVMALGDLLYQRWSFEKRQRMTRREVRDEAKDREGNPQVRSRFRTLQRDLSRQRMIAAVADADVVVTNPTHVAVALRYDRAEMAAPQVLAKGKGHVAARIREAARKHGVPLVENPPLARMLHKTTQVGREVPEKLFQAVAEVLAYVYRLDPRRAVAWSAAR